jgi:hypothetical protein
MQGALLNPYLVTSAPPGATDPDFASVVALYHFDETPGTTTFVDSSVSANNMVGVGAETSSTQSVYGGVSLYDDNSIATSPTIANYAMGSGPFTIEFRYYPTNITAGFFMLCSKDVFTDAGNWKFLVNSAGSRKLSFRSNGVDLDSPSANLVNNTWHAIAYDRNASNVGRLYLNGAVVTSWTDSLNYNGASQIIELPGSAFASGGAYYDELRITKGVARYQGAYTPATAAFPNS